MMYQNAEKTTFFSVSSLTINFRLSFDYLMLLRPWVKMPTSSGFLESVRLSMGIYVIKTGTEPIKFSSIYYLTNF